MIKDKACLNEKKFLWSEKLLHFLCSFHLQEKHIGPIDEEIVPLILISILLNNENKYPIYYVASNLGRVEQCYNEFSLWCKTLHLSFHSIVLPDSSLSSSQTLFYSDSPRAKALFQILNDAPDVIFTSVSGLMGYSPDPHYMKNSVLTLKKNFEISPSQLAKELVNLDYDDESEVTVPGEFSWRGGIFDVYSSSEEYPARFEFFGNTIESIRLFNPQTQLSIKKIEQYKIILRTGSAHSSNQMLQQPPPVRTLNYLSQSKFLLFAEDSEKIYQHLIHYGDISDTNDWNSFLSNNNSQIYHLENTVGATKFLCTPFLCFSTGNKTSKKTINTNDDNFNINFFSEQIIANRVEQLLLENYHVSLIFPHEINNERIFIFLSEYNININHPLLTVNYSMIPSGFILPSEKAVVLTIHELFNLPKKLTTNSCVQEKELNIGTSVNNIIYDDNNSSVLSAFDLNEGDYAVHINYGICIYHGLSTILQEDNVKQEVITLEFADDILMHLNISEAALITRYVGTTSSENITLSKIAGNRWKNKFFEANNAVRALALDMLKMQAARTHLTGTSFQKDTEEQVLFEQSFPFAETKDQIKAIAEIKKDMESVKPMDRLLCGDVGFGKTELAMRAAYKCVLSGKQVALLVPTTVLAQQHYLTFSERFAGTSVLIEQLSGFKTKAEQQIILNRMKKGTVDIVIGTHRIVQKDVSFKNLGLLIIDEEQKFGVIHKDRLKNLRTMVDVLTMTATPIPRTLHLSLSGIRDMSTLVHAPVNRLPIRTVFSQYEKNIIRKAIEFELSRGGQVYYLHNRVKTIDKEAAFIQEMFPDILVGIAHGQMGKSLLEKIMRQFISGEIKVLVCTTIIESGIDIPNANTIIINRADTLGLAELYQLRGRVGRWSKQAYAYMLLPNDNIVNGNAKKRIDAIRKYTHLGAGFQLAMSDLEIRGAGNILGAEQSGQINAIGYHLYCYLLHNCVSMFTGKSSILYKECDIYFDFLIFGVSTHPNLLIAGIPLNYVADEKIRLHLYRRLSIIDIGNAEDILNDFELEMVDRFGPIPDCFKILLLYFRIKYYAQKKFINSISCIDNVIKIERNGQYLRLKDKSLPKLSSILKPAQKIRMIFNLLNNLEQYIFV